MTRPLLLALALMAGAALSLPARAADEPRFLSATITKVNDGDSIEVKTAAGPARVRLSGIDTPEFDQPYAPEATAALRARLPPGSAVELEVVTRDQFRRLVAVIWRIADGERQNVNESMLREGHAWAYRRYMNDAGFCELEAAARDRKLGLWALPVADWVYPPEWRYLKNGEIRTLPAPYVETLETCLAVLKKAGAGTYEPPK
jgi:endonuclease YncB( thermonuclease family)